jgi:hypothetical protein
MTKPYHKNVPGPFYVEAGCCVTCAIPVNGAPDVFAWDDEAEGSHCFVYRQPRTADGFGKVVEVMKHAEFNCIRYRGSDAAEIRQLRERGLEGQCDLPLAKKP